MFEPSSSPTSMMKRPILKFVSIHSKNRGTHDIDLGNKSGTA